MNYPISDQVWYSDANFHSEHGHLTKKSTFFKFKMADRRHTENRFWLYIGAILVDLCKFRNGDEESHADIGYVTIYGLFPKFMMADGSYFENSFWCLRHFCNELMLSSVFQ